MHSGDFTETSLSIDKLRRKASNDEDATKKPQKPEYHDLLGTSPTTPWYQPHSSLRAAFQSDLRGASSNISSDTQSIDIPNHPNQRPARSRAPSLQSFSSSFVLKPPTSPLVQQSNNDDLDFSPTNLSPSLTQASRRHTIPPHGFQAFQPPSSGNYATLAQAARQPPLMQRESTFPLQGYQPRRSLTSSFSLQAASPPQTPYIGRSRRPSYTPDASPLQHASMVGSYEESILRGRMSTTPSKPLDFTASIGALGKGDCKPKHPVHVSIGFPAVYYSWGNGNSHGVSVNDEPSPYVGLIDLEHKLAPPETKARTRRRQATPPSNDEAILGDVTNKSAAPRKRERRKRRSPSPLLKVGGSYRIPQQGHLQILIKNPNKTAVKLFLVPYDLEGMEPGTKTFIRQRCYSAGPVIEKPLTSRSVSDSTIGMKNAPTDSKSKPTLRYLIQVNICCPSRGRFYLYKSIHVVFANRVPDNKEGLRNEILLPEPKYSAYKATAENTPTPGSTNPSTLKSQRRLSYGGHGVLGENAPDPMDGIVFPTPFPPLPSPILAPPPPLTSLPFPFPSSENKSRYSPPRFSLAATSDLDATRGATARSPTTTANLRKTNNISPTSSFSNENSNGSGSSGRYGKLSRGEAGYGGVFGRPGTPEPGEGLLARKLRGLDVEREGVDGYKDEERDGREERWKDGMEWEDE